MVYCSVPAGGSSPLQTVSFLFNDNFLALLTSVTILSSRPTILSEYIFILVGFYMASDCGIL